MVIYGNEVLKEKKREYTTVSVPNSLMKRVDEALGSGKFGYQNRSDLILEAIRRRLRELGLLEENVKLPTLEHYNLNENGVMILDRELDPPKGRLIQVYFKPDKVLCDFDQTDDCRHVAFALELSEVQGILRKKGWKPK